MPRSFATPVLPTSFLALFLTVLSWGEITIEPYKRADNSPYSSLFTQLAAEQTGLIVDNAYDDTQMWSSRYRAFMGGGMGSGVAAGDFDNDGLPDLYVSLKTKPGRLFRNLGDLKFEDVTEDAGLAEEGSIFGWIKSAVSEDEIAWRQGATFADVDNDGDLDLYVCRNDASNFLYINQGDGTFEEEGEARGLGIVDGSVVGAFCDYDRDGWLDVLVLTNQVEGNEPNGRPDRLFRNTGKGRFKEVTRAAGIESVTFGHSATWIDFDDDNWPDLYIANDFSGSDLLFRNNQDGTFTNVVNQVTPHTPYSSMGADLGDVNNDGHFDLLVADMATTTRERDRRGLAASRNDMLSTGTTNGIAPQYTRNALLLNTGAKVFGEAAFWAGLEATDWTWSVRFEDFDNDGWEDLHVTNGMVREANNSDLLARMMRAMSDLQRIGVMKRSPELLETNLAYRNREGHGFEPTTVEWGLEDIGVSFGAATADFDRDGDLDLAYLNYNGGLSFFRNNASAEANSIQVYLQGTKSNRFGVGAVAYLTTNDGSLQSRSFTVSRGYASGSELVAHFGIGRDTTAKRLIVRWPSGIEQEFKDLQANQRYIVKESERDTSPSSPTPQPLFAQSSQARIFDASELAIPDNEQPFLPFRTDRGGPAASVADIDGDGREDLFLGSTSGSPAQLVLQNGNGFAEPIAFQAVNDAIEDGPALVFDADADGDNDLLLTKASASAGKWPDAFQPVLYLNNGERGLAPSNWIPQLSANAGAVAAADFDADGDLDLFIGGRSIPGRYPANPRSYLLRNDGDRFVNASDLSPALAEAGLVKSALASDVDQDGRIDLLVATEWGPVRYFRNADGTRFADQTEATGFASGGRGWWNGIAAADFNGDGRLDYAVGNLGLNTIYQPSPNEPATLFYGDFAQNGTRLLAEAVYDDGELFPLRSLVDIGKWLPHVLRKFPRNDDFAKANMTQVYGDAPLQKALRLEAENAQSGVFLSQPDGRFSFAPLPREAQISASIGLLAQDFDGDGLADLVLTQNTDVAVPRFHGWIGMFLKGLPDGTFTTVSAEKSGIVIPRNGRAAVVLDANRDARPDLFVTQHGAETQLLLNQSSTGASWLEVTLRDAPGNQHAAGAFVRFEFASGRVYVEEVSIGGGWFSQSSQSLFLAIPEGDSLTACEITWPTGETTRHAASRKAGTWEINRPLPE